MAVRPKKERDIKYPDIFEEFVKYYEQFRTGVPPAAREEAPDAVPDLAAHEEMLMQFMRCFILGDPEREKKFILMVWGDILPILQKRAGNHETEISEFLKMMFDCSTPEEFFNELFLSCPK